MATVLRTVVLFEPSELSHPGDELYLVRLYYLLVGSSL